MDNNSRTKNVVRNSSFALITQVINLLLSFIVRTLFIKKLGSEYLGVNGLFTNILTMLSFAELGIGNAIIFSMYKPAAKGNIEKVKSLMQLYKKAYTTIALIVFALGVCVIPFLKFIIKDVPNIKENITYIYILFLVNTSISYMYTYKKSIISVYQLDYIISIFDFSFNVLKNILQCISLIVLNNYIAYLLIQIICTFVENVIISIKANKLYPFLKEKNIKPLKKGEKHYIFSNVKSLVVYKFGNVILDGTDNIIISAMINTTAVGLLSNYTLIINSVKGILNKINSALTSTVGNLNAVESNEKKEKVLYDCLFVSFWIYGLVSIGIIVLINNFIYLWVGQEYVLSIYTVIALALSLFVDGLHIPAYTYRVTMGLFKEGKIAPFFTAIINIILSILLAFKYEITGILLATSISRLLTTTWYDPYLIYKRKLKTSPKEYIIKYIEYFIILVIGSFISYYTVNLITINGIVGLIVKAIVCFIEINVIFIICLSRREEFKNTLIRVKKLIKK